MADDRPVQLGQPVRPGDRRPLGLPDKTVEALGSMARALETVERVRGHLYTLHQLTGTADFELDRTVALLRETGHGDWADRIERELIGLDVIPGHWTFQIVEEYDDTYYEPFRDLERALRDDLADGRRHLYEAELVRRRSDGS